MWLAYARKEILLAAGTNINSRHLTFIRTTADLPHVFLLAFILHRNSKYTLKHSGFFDAYAIGRVFVGFALE